MNARRNGTGEPIRVLIAVDRLGYGEERYHGSGRLLVEWSKALHDRGVDVTTVVLRSARAFRTPPGHEIIYLDRGLYDIRTFLDFRRLMKTRRVQIAHLQGFGSLAFGRLAARSLGIPVVAHIHADHTAETRGYPWFVQFVDRLLAPLTTKTIAVSDAVARFAKSYQGFRESQIEVWHNSVDLSLHTPASPEERAATRASLGIPSDAPVVITVARLESVKGVDLLVEAWPTVLRSVPSARLLLAGDGPQREELTARLSEAGVLDSVQFLGHRHDVPELLHAADVLALPSRSEGLPLAALEVVAHAVGGVPELIKDGENGRLVPPEPAALAAALIEVLTDSDLRSDLALRARPSVESLALASYAERLEHMYRQTVAGHPGKGARTPIQSTSSSSAS
jgi:glycosyltransferase involved in cell wall biosynthesis